MTILVVGDRSQIEGPLKSLPFVEAIQQLDTEGNALPRRRETGGGRYGRAGSGGSGRIGLTTEVGARSSRLRRHVGGHVSATCG